MSESNVSALRYTTLPNGDIKLQKNTGAWYTAEGQVIVAVYAPHTGDAWFNDQSRGIEGHVKIAKNLEEQLAWLQIKHKYDYMEYNGAHSYKDDDGSYEVSWWQKESNSRHVGKIDICTRI